LPKSSPRPIRLVVIWKIWIKWNISVAPCRACWQSIHLNHLNSQLRSICYYSAG
jgi:hypothetical protein